MILSQFVLFALAASIVTAEIINCSDKQACVVSALCVNGRINTEGTGVLKPRFGEDCDNSTGKVCCLRPDETEDDKDTTPSPKWITCKDNELCVENVRCNNGKIRTDGAGILTPRISVECDTSASKTCCEKPKKFSSATATVSPPISGNGKVEPTVYKDWKECGDSTGISPQNQDQLPWNVALLKKSGPSNKFVCAGALIHPKVALTAGHCVYQQNKDLLVVRAGNMNTPSTQEDRNIEAITIHENYNDSNLFNDIAILFLVQDFNSDFVGSICVPSQDKSFYDERCFVSVNDQKNIDGALRWKTTEVPVLTRQMCKEKFRKTLVGPWFKLDRSFICAGGEAKNEACAGDGGGPLICKVAGLQNRYTLAGFVAWNVGCELKDVPLAYVNMGHFRDWIDDNIIENKLLPFHQSKM